MTYRIVSLLVFAVSFAMARAFADAPAKAKELIDRGAEYLRVHQQPDGSWQQGRRDPPGISALVLKALVQSGKFDDKTDFVKKGYDRLLSFQNPDGGIYQQVLANYNTAIAISALAAANDPAMKAPMDRATAFLKGLQIDEKTQHPKGEKIDANHAWYGGTGYGVRGRPDGSNTQMFIDALHDAGVKQDDPAYANALKFISRLQNRSESNDQPWAGDDGGFIYTPADGGASNAGEYNGPDGRRMLRSYGLMTYGGLKSMLYAGLTKDDPRVKAAWDWISKNWTLDEHPGMRAAGADKAQAGMYYYYHTLARALNAYDEPMITGPDGKRHDWRLELIDKIGALQKPDGSWIGEASWMEQNPSLVTAYVVSALNETVEDLKQHPPK